MKKAHTQPRQSGSRRGEAEGENRSTHCQQSHEAEIQEKIVCLIHNEKAKSAASKPADPRIVEIEKLQEETFACPTVFQLTQIAAMLARREDFEDDSKVKSVADSAVFLWNHCIGAVLEELAHKKDGLHILPEDMRESVELDCIVLHEHFPMPFEYAIKKIVRGKTRQPDRHKHFRDYLRANAAAKFGTDKAAMEKAVEKWMANRKANGFSPDDLRNALSSFPEWYERHIKESRRAAGLKSAANKAVLKKSRHSLKPRRLK